MTKPPGFAFRVLAGSAAFVIVIAGMKAAEPILVPFLLAIFISIISTPPLLWLERRKVPTPIAILIIISIIIIGLTLVGLLAVASIKDFIHQLPLYQARLKIEMTTAIHWINQHNLGIDIRNLDLQKIIDPSQAMTLASIMLNSITAILSKSLLIFFIVIFIMIEASGFSAKLNSLDHNARIADIFGRFLGKVNRYMSIKTLISILTGVLAGIWLALLGVDYAFLWGLLAFLFNYIPAIGSTLAAIPAVLLAFLQLGMTEAILAAAGCSVINVVLGNVVEPRLMGKGLGLSELAVFLSLVFWGWVLGPVGMFLSIPLTMIIKIALASREDTRWLSILLDSEKAPTTQ